MYESKGTAFLFVRSCLISIRQRSECGFFEVQRYNVSCFTFPKISPNVAIFRNADISVYFIWKRSLVYLRLQFNYFSCLCEYYVYCISFCDCLIVTWFYDII